MKSEVYMRDRNDNKGSNEAYAAGSVTGVNRKGQGDPTAPSEAPGTTPDRPDMKRRPEDEEITGGEQDSLKTKAAKEYQMEHPATGQTNSQVYPEVKGKVAKKVEEAAVHNDQATPDYRDEIYRPKPEAMPESRDRQS